MSICISLEEALLDIDSCIFTVTRGVLSDRDKNLPGSSRQDCLGSSCKSAVTKLCARVDETSEDVINTAYERACAVCVSAKPRYGAVEVVRHLRDNGVNVSVFSRLEQSIVDSCIQSHAFWLSGLPVHLYSSDLFSQLSSTSSPLHVLTGDPSVAEVAASQGCTPLVVKVPGLPADLYSSVSPVSLFDSLAVLPFPSFFPSVPALSWPALPELVDLVSEPQGLDFDAWQQCVPLPSPVKLAGAVVTGFKRGSKILGIPTANLEMSDAVRESLKGVNPGVYLGWASVGGKNKEVYKMVMSVGWNPCFDNTTKTVEPYLFHDFESDFYGEELRLVLTGFIRPEAAFSSLTTLVRAIYLDVGVSRRLLENAPHKQYQTDSFFSN